VYAVNDLVSVDQAIKAVTKQRGPKEGPPTADEIATAADAERIYTEREQPTWDAIAAEIEAELTARGELAEGEHIAPATGLPLGEAFAVELPRQIGGEPWDDGSDDEVTDG